MSPLNRLALAATAAHGTDQLTLAALPFAALAAAAGPGATGALIAAQSAAWLLVSIPAGVWVDRHDRLRLLRAALAATAVACLVGALVSGYATLLAGAGFLAAAGTVVFTLSATARLPALLPPARLPAGNARLELARAGATLLAPLLAGWLARDHGVASIFAAASLTAVLGMIVLRAGATAEPPPAHDRSTPLLTAAREGARHMWRHPALRTVAICAVAWNTGFFALLAVLVPFAVGELALPPTQAGLILGALGAGQVVAALRAPAIARRLPMHAILLFGPAASVGASLLLLGAPAGSPILPCVAMALLGFGPMLWLIARNTLVQLVTPPMLLGRVNATMQLTVFGVRPLGALAGGLAASLGGAQAALVLAVAGFTLSLLAIVSIRSATLPEAAQAQ